MTRLKAAGIHLALSALVVAPVLAAVFFVWYPGPTFEIAGARTLVKLLVGIALVAGPLLTLIVYKRGKRGMSFDLWVIGILQLAALGYGSFVTYQERPYYLVFAVDRFSLLSERRVDSSQIRYDELRDKPFGDLIRVFARKPEDPDEVQALLQSVVFDGRPDLDARPEYWEPYAAGRDHVLERILPLDGFEAANEDEARRVDAAIERHRADRPRLGVVPIVVRETAMAMLVDGDTAEPLDIVRIDPWQRRVSGP